MIILDEKHHSDTELHHARAAGAARQGSAGSGFSDSQSNSTLLKPPPYARPGHSSYSASSSSISLLSQGSPTSPYFSSSQVSSPSSTAPVVRRDPVSRSNNLYITRTSGTLKGKWVIDTDLRLPRAMLPQIAEDAIRKNLMLETKAGRISAHVDVKASRGSKERAFFELKADPGCIKLRLKREGPNGPPLTVNCQSAGDNITIHLPHDFRGVIRTWSSTGEILLSRLAHKSAILIQQEAERSTYYIGSTPAPDDSWDDSDQMELVAKEGWIKLLYIDEPPSEDMHSVNDLVDNIKIHGVRTSVGKLWNDGLDKMSKFTVPGFVGSK